MNIVASTCVVCTKDYDACKCEAGPYERAENGTYRTVPHLDQKTLRGFLRARRTKMHLTLGQLARKLGPRWDVPRLAALEHGRAHWRALTEEDFGILAFALDTDIEKLIELSGLCPHCLGTGRKG